MGKKSNNEIFQPVARILTKFSNKLLPIGELDLSVKKIPTNIFTLDAALMGGIPMNKLIEIAGDSGTGKTSLALHICKQLQKAYPDKAVAYLDAESAVDDVMALNIYGLDRNRTFIARPDQNVSAEDLVDIMVDAAFDPAFCAVVLDSVAGLVTEEEMSKQASDISISPVAKLLGRNIKKMNSRQNPDGAAVLLLNQNRRTIGPALAGGGKIITTGGQALEFYPSLRLRLRRIASVQDTKDGPEVGFITRCLTVKARHSHNHVTCDWSVIYGSEGISTIRAVVTMALDQGIIKQSGSWFQVLDKEKCQGLPKMIELLRDNPELLEAVQNSIVFKTELAA